jgi:glycosyltransferase involved in cell wall biosynthesis
VFPLDNWTYNRSVSRDFAVLEADVFEAHNNSAYGIPEALRKHGVNKPLVHLIHGTLADEYEQGKKGPQTLKSRLANALMKQQAKQEKSMAEKATLIVTISRYSQSKILEHYGIGADRVRIIANGVDTKKYKPSDSAAPRQQFGLGKEPCVLFVGSFIHRKGLPFLVDAAEKIVREQAKTKFLMVGDGPLKGWLLDTLRKKNIVQNFVFLGTLQEDKLIDAYNAADVFVLPSIQEGQGIVLLEAQACGKPVVAFNVGGVKEAVRHNETGFLLESGNTDGLAGKLLELLENDTLRKKMGDAGPRFVTENYTWDLCAQRMLETYKEALAK